MGLIDWLWPDVYLFCIIAQNHLHDFERWFYSKIVKPFRYFFEETTVMITTSLNPLSHWSRHVSRAGSVLTKRSLLLSQLMHQERSLYASAGQVTANRCSFIIFKVNTAFNLRFLNLLGKMNQTHGVLDKGLVSYIYARFYLSTLPLSRSPQHTRCRVYILLASEGFGWCRTGVRRKPVVRCKLVVFTIQRVPLLGLHTLSPIRAVIEFETRITIGNLSLIYK